MNLVLMSKNLRPEKMPKLKGLVGLVLYNLKHEIFSIPWSSCCSKIPEEHTKHKLSRFLRSVKMGYTFVFDPGFKFNLK